MVMASPPPSNQMVTFANYSEFAHHLWLLFSVHEILNTIFALLGFSTYGATNLVNSGMRESESVEYHSYRHSFTHMP